MHQLTQVELDFCCRSEPLATWFSAAGERLFVDELLPVAQQVLDEFDTDVLLQLDEIQLQLPPLQLPAERYRLQHCFREELRRQLWLLLPDAQRRQGRTLTATEQQQLVAALRRADSARLQQDWAFYLQHAAELVALLRRLAANSDLCRVLAFGLNDTMLAELVLLLAPAEQRFILQLMAQPQLFSPGRVNIQLQQQPVPPPALQQRQRHLWQLSLSYLLVDRGSRFNRRSYLHNLLQRMAAHDNVSLQSLVQHMQLTLVQSRQLFARHSPLLLQLSELLAGITQAPQPSGQIDSFAVVPGYFSRRTAQPLAVLPTIAMLRPLQGSLLQASSLQAAPIQTTALQHQARRWRQWQSLLLQGQLTLAQQRSFNWLLQQLLAQRSALWLDAVRQQLLAAPLLQRLIQYASDNHLQQLFQQLQPASVAGMQPYTALLQWSLDGISLPLPLYRQARWQPLLQCSLQRQPLTLPLLLCQLQLWLEAETGSVASRALLQQLAQQLLHYTGNTAYARREQLLQQLNLQLAATAPLAVTPTGAGSGKAAARQSTKAATSTAVAADVRGRLSRVLQLLLQLLTPGQQQRVQAIAAPLLQHFSSGRAAVSPDSASSPVTVQLFSYNLLQQLAPALAPQAMPHFYRQLAGRLRQLSNTEPAPAEIGILLQQLTLLSSRALAGQITAQTEPGAAALAQSAGGSLLSQASSPHGGLSSYAPLSQDAVASDAEAAMPGSRLQYQAQAAAEAIQPAAAQQWLANAGIVLLAPYLPLLLQRLGLVSARRLVSTEAGWQSCALLHYMATGQCELPADYRQQWPLLMLLSAVQAPCPAGYQLQFTPEELALADSLLAGVLTQWPQLANSSVATLRECFLQRGGTLQRSGNGSGWQLQVDNGPYDMLLDGLPWSYSLICYPWMQGEVYVHWRG
ncbi:contractile injection system tape measure protein [Rheinheimera sp.]|uniref:contractile injection system tape measure protein n=1 Tax=Rheinheimera sp. TaxID=1869214 RepID=UPI002735C798|nr:contractile injection system tape measure protein [Rheinheimera sp.]MDP2715133.1 contractile injection system tape measure protein [Rheinheimera sp.]